MHLCMYIYYVVCLILARDRENPINMNDLGNSKGKFTPIRRCSIGNRGKGCQTDTVAFICKILNTVAVTDNTGPERELGNLEIFI